MNESTLAAKTKRPLALFPPVHDVRTVPFAVRWSFSEWQYVFRVMTLSYCPSAARA